MDTSTNIDKSDRVRRNTSDKTNNKIDEGILEIISDLKHKSPQEISRRIAVLEKEWSIERKIEVNASSLIITGLLLGTFVDKRWYILPGLVAGFLLQHGIQGWCPPVPILRALNARTRKEIDWEKFALKYIRGDFDHLSKEETQQLFAAVRKI